MVNKKLIENMKSKNWKVRKEAAKTIDIKYLPEMIKDEHQYVRRKVSKRIDVKELTKNM